MLAASKDVLYELLRIKATKVFSHLSTALWQLGTTLYNSGVIAFKEMGQNMPLKFYKHGTEQNLSFLCCSGLGEPQLFQEEFQRQEM